MLNDFPTHKDKTKEIGTDKTTYISVFLRAIGNSCDCSVNKSFIDEKLNLKIPWPPFSLNPNLKTINIEKYEKTQIKKKAGSTQINWLNTSNLFFSKLVVCFLWWFLFSLKAKLLSVFFNLLSSIRTI
ncbi:hypothetical protein mflW37_0220 [Mesoplasma florum W37]|uniref:Uncharacterized protein n=1 Tax=Mesoplasma florum TaxID=2151 RepID=A0AAD0MQI8_MESFO|nr:hypothetical protein mflW37_0220 [Mesoplasma florum W37]AVN65427.1 hypothetical protein MflW12_0220 [Mesoplasma florum]